MKMILILHVVLPWLFSPPQIMLPILPAASIFIFYFLFYWSIEIFFGDATMFKTEQSFHKNIWLHNG